MVGRVACEERTADEDGHVTEGEQNRLQNDMCRKLLSGLNERHCSLLIVDCRRKVI